MRYGLALLACLGVAACGDDSHTQRDAGDDADGDADIDADPNVRGAVSVHLIDKNDAPLGGFHVVFIDTDGTVSDVVTGTDGFAGASVFPGASATALRAATGGSYSLTTVLSLVPNDVVTLVSAAPDVSSLEDPFTQRTVNLPSIDVVTATKSGSVGTYSTHAPHGLTVGDKVAIADVFPDSAFNGAKTVASVPTATSFTVSLGGGSATASTGGTANKTLSFTVSYPAYGGATGYEVHTPCGPFDVGTQTSPVLTLPTSCATTGDVLVFAKTSVTTEAAFAQIASVTFTAGGSATITDTWHAVGAFTTTLTTPTTRVTDVEVARYTPYVRGNPPASGSGTTKGSDVMMTFDAATATTAWMRTQLSCPNGAATDCTSNAIGTAQQTITQKVDGTQTTYALDIGASLLPWVSAVYQPIPRTLEITVTGSTAYDLFEANLRYVRGQTIYTWRVFGAAAATFTFPALPTSLPGDPTIRPTDAQSSYQVYLCETDAVGGYRDAIKDLYRALGTCETSSQPGVRTYGGTLNRLSAWN